MVLRVLLILSLPMVIDVQFVLYHSHNYQTSSLFFDCIYSSWIDDPSNNDKLVFLNNYLIPYCRRPDDDDVQEYSIFPSNQNIIAQFSFNDLNHQGVTSNQLLLWSSSIDIAERYEMDKGNAKYVFYNCSPPWFGEMCQYKFTDGSPTVFSEIVQITFTQRSKNSTNITIGTCYRFLSNCDRGPWPFCLDWREVCDGKVDCFDGEDEHMCEKLDLNQCTNDEYRCHNGQCIPSVFFRDGLYNLDCLDGSDEQELDRYQALIRPTTFAKHCIKTPTFRCEERVNRYMHQFACGDGQYNAEFLMPHTQEFCENNRDKEINRRILTVFDYIENSHCRQAFYCALHANRSFGYHSFAGDIRVRCPEFEGNWDKDCEPLNRYCSNEWLVFPEKPIMFGIFQFIYLTNRSIDEFKKNMQPDFVCFDIKKCPTLSCAVIHIEFIRGLTCCYISSLTSVDSMNSFNDLSDTFSSIFKRCLKSGNETSCVNPSDFYCNKSLKCISSHRVNDGVTDCDLDEDELFSACSFNDSNRFVCKSRTESCLSLVAVGNGWVECNKEQDELIYVKDDFMEKKLYGKLCTELAASRHFQELGDWTNCNWWPCNTPYVNCDGVWDCPNGADELNCPNSKCSFNEHECNNDELGANHCLSIVHMFDKRINDVFQYTIRSLYFDNESRSNNDDDYYSWNKSKCITDDDIYITASKMVISEEDVCLKGHLLQKLSYKIDVMRMDTKTKLCTLKVLNQRNRSKYFLNYFRLGNFPTESSSSLIPQTRIFEKPIVKNFQMNSKQNWYCHRGILVLHSINQTERCLCPPSYFGSRCQWQNQRVSLTFQFVSTRANLATFIFQLVIMLIDEKGEITSYHEQLMYTPSLDCKKKFNIYLLYPTRPKHDFSNYSIRIDAFDKTTLDFWASWYLPILFQFMPVNRISAQLFIAKGSEMKSCPMCGTHGKCVHYSNKNSSFYCQCNRGYTGIYCNETYSCKCSNDSFCLSPLICVCSLHQFGSYCYLKQSICEPNPCQNNGICIPSDNRIDLQTFICFCKQGYYGSRCEYSSTQIILNLDETIISTSSFVYAHFVTARVDEEYDLITSIKKIPIHSNFITIRSLQSFNILFVQLKNKTYYLLVLRETPISNENISSQLLPKQRCLYFTDLLNSTIVGLEHETRLKFYPQGCRQNRQLMCFYDENLMCICDLDRFANCFPFNHSMNNDCEGNNDCKYGGQCFQNSRTCPTTSICVCEGCHYGSKCELSSLSYIISLDPILGYHIIPSASLNQQSSVVKVSIAIVTILVFIGLIDGLLSIMTFKEKKSKEVGCGYYLLISSIVSILMILILTTKLCHLLLSQMEIIQNRSVLFFNCLIIDFILKVLLSFNEWLIAYVAIERLLAVIRGVRFDKVKSRKMVKWIVPIILLLTILSHIHDPIHRQIIDDLDGDEKRVWCFVQYSPSMNIYNLAITLIHFIGPLLTNLISAILIVKYLVRNRSTVRSTASFKEELYQHKHLLLPPGMLVLLGTPRLVITFLSGCMRSARDPWLYVFGYFISYVPSILIFITFVLPSENYKEQFRTVVRRQLRRFRPR